MSELSLSPSLPNFEYVEINGMRLPEPNQLYTALWKALTTKQASPAKACQYLRTRFESRNRNRPVCVLLVDELDYLLTRQQEVLYNLFDWPTFPHSRLIVLGISNTIDLPDLLQPRVNSRLGLTKLHFEPYSKEQIETIISDRLRSLPAFGDGAVELCARKIASISGDMRRALQICRRAAEICEEGILRKQALRMGGGGGGKKGLLLSAAGSSAAAAAGGISMDPSLLVNAEHITSAISDLQSSSFIQWLRVRAARVPFEPLLLASMIACMKFAAGGPSNAASSARAGHSGAGDENPLVTTEALCMQAFALLDTKGYLKLLSLRSGVALSDFPKPSPEDFARLVAQWAEVRLVQLSFVRGERAPRLQLNVLIDDIQHAYLNEPLWEHLRN